MALRCTSRPSAFKSALWAKRKCVGNLHQPSTARLTHSCPRRLEFAVTHNAALFHDVLELLVGFEETTMRRREFITLVGGSAATWPLVARAQQSAMPVIGFLGLTSPEAFAPLTAAFQHGLRETGFAEGQNVAIVYRWAHGQFDQLPALASDLVRQRLSVLAAMGTPASALAAKAATKVIPIVFVTGGDPVGVGLVDSLNRPRGNATGVYMLTVALEPKRLEVINELVPNAAILGVVVDPNSPDTAVEIKELLAAASTLGKQIKTFNVSHEGEISAAFAAMAKQRVAAAMVTSSPIYLPQRQKFTDAAARYAMPTVYFVRDFVEAGGLMSYGTSFADAYRLVGIYAGRILKGDKPGDLPVQQSVKVELVINLKAAKTLGISVPLPLLGRADEAIE
jgi:putative ABC transport system substrate-binding protein